MHGVELNGVAVEMSCSCLRHSNLCRWRSRTFEGRHCLSWKSPLFFRFAEDYMIDITFWGVACHLFMAISDFRHNDILAQVNGAEYEGHWQDGRFHDEGELRLPDGTSYDPWQRHRNNSNQQMFQNIPKWKHVIVIQPPFNTIFKKKIFIYIYIYIIHGKHTYKESSLPSNLLRSAVGAMA